MIFYSQEDLYKILKAYTIHNPRDGYCQAMAPIAAVLLMHMPAEQAFWCFVSICEKYVQGYYSPGLVWSALFYTFFLQSISYKTQKFSLQFEKKLRVFFNSLILSSLFTLQKMFDLFFVFFLLDFKIRCMHKSRGGGSRKFKFFEFTL